jgi:nitroreductase
MDLLEGIQSRASALKLAAPGPTREHLEQILRAGMRAPDHGRLKPWRFVVLEGEATATLGDAMAELFCRKAPQCTQAQLDAERNKVRRAPTIVIAAARISKGKIPEIEQVASVAAGVQNMLLAAHALGYGAMWKTGAAAYDAEVKAALGLLPEDHIVATVYLGTTVTPGPIVLLPLEPALIGREKCDVQKSV